MAKDFEDRVERDKKLGKQRSTGHGGLSKGEEGKPKSEKRPKARPKRRDNDRPREIPGSTVNPRIKGADVKAGPTGPKPRPDAVPKPRPVTGPKPRPGLMPTRGPSQRAASPGSTKAAKSLALASSARPTPREKDSSSGPLAKLAAAMRNNRGKNESKALERMKKASRKG